MPTDGSMTWPLTDEDSIDTPSSGIRQFADLDGYPKYKDTAGNTHTFGGSSFLSVVDYGADPSGVADSGAAVATAETVANFANGGPSIIYWPQGTYLVNGTITAAAYYFAHLGAGNPQTTIISTSTTGDLFDVNQWYCTIKDMLITAPATTWTSGTIAGGTVTVAAITVGQWPTAGTISYGTSAGGWGTFSYAGRTGTTFTGTANVSGSGTMTAGAPIQLKSGGYAVNVSTGQNYCLLDNAWITNFYNGVNQAGSTNSMRNLQIRNSANVAINVNNTNAQVYLHNVTCDNTPTNQPVTGNLQVLVCGLLQISDCDFIHGGATNCSMNSTGAGIFSVYVVNTFFDTSAGADLSITGSTTMRSLKFTNCWFSSATNGIVLNNASCTGLDFIGCDIYNNSGTAVVQTSVGDVAFLRCRVASPVAGTQVGFALNGAPSTTRIAIEGCTIGTVGAFFNFATGITIAAGTYGSLRIKNNDFVANTANITDSRTTGMNADISGNTGLIIAPNANYTATAIPLTTVTNVDSRGGVVIPAAARPSSGTIAVYATNAATLQTLTVTVKYGTTNTNADATIFTGPVLAAGTAALGGGQFIFDWELLTATTIGIAYRFINLNNAATGISGTITTQSGLATPATISTAAQNFLGVYFSSATAAAITIRSVKYAVQSQ